jgi:hypothetical protein
MTHTTGGEGTYATWQWKMPVIYQQLCALQAARRARHYANWIRHRSTRPNIATMKLQGGSSGFICAFHGDLSFISSQNVIFVCNSSALIHIRRCCTILPSKSCNPQRLSAPCSKLSMWHSNTTLMSPTWCVFAFPLLSADRHIGRQFSQWS